MSQKGALWIGGLEHYMDEDFIQRALHAMGEINIISIKIIKNKFTGQVAGYGFINFTNDQVALTAMHKLNGKVIPNTQPPVRFKLNHNSNRLLPGEKNHSIWVGDLSPEVDDFALYQFFSARFKTVISAKVVLDDAGASKGFGFIRFGNETEQQTALSTMQGIAGLGDKPIKVSVAVHKAKDPSDTSGQYTSGGVTMDPNNPWGTDYYNQYSQYWSQMAAWNQYQQQYYGYPPQDGSQSGGIVTSVPPPTIAPPPPAPAPVAPSTVATTTANASATVKAKPSKSNSIFDGPLTELVPHTAKLDYKQLNRKYLTASEELYNAMMTSGWSEDIDHPGSLLLA